MVGQHAQARAGPGGRRCAAGPCAHCCAQGAADRGNYLFVGFPMNGIKPYLSGECNVSPKGTYAINLVQYFSLLSDSIAGRAIHRVGEPCFANDIVAFEGHLYLQ
jgi:hypothetical protein